MSRSDGGVSPTKILYAIFPTPLIVATAPLFLPYILLCKTHVAKRKRAAVDLFLPYILLCKTQGRSVNTFDNRSEVMHLPLPFAVLHSITGCSRKGIERESLLGEGVNPYS